MRRKSHAAISVRASVLWGTGGRGPRTTERFLVPDPDGGAYPLFDSASWLKAAQDNASWNTASWADASWNTASWNTASASWNSDSFPSASWNSASWLKVLAVDNAANEMGGEG